MNKSPLSIAIASLLACTTYSVPAAQIAISPPSASSNNNLTSYASGGTQGFFKGTNDVDMTWDGTMFTDSSDYSGPDVSTSNMTLSSSTTVNGNPWVAHDVQVFGPGVYTFDTELGGAGGANTETGIMTMTVGPNQLGAHLLFDWNDSNNMDVVIVWELNSVFGSGYGMFLDIVECGSGTIPGANCMWDGPGFTGGNSANGHDPAAPWSFASVDVDSDGIPGIQMQPGNAFQSQAINFNLQSTNPLYAPVAIVAPFLLPVVPANVVAFFSGRQAYDFNGDPLTYQWDFGDGTSTGPTGVIDIGRQYTAPGLYTVTLTVSDGVLSDSANIEILVSE